MRCAQILEFSSLNFICILLVMTDNRWYMGIYELMYEDIWALHLPPLFLPIFLIFGKLYHHSVSHFVTFVKTHSHITSIYFCSISLFLVLDNISWLLALYDEYINPLPFLPPVLFFFYLPASDSCIFTRLLTFSFHSIAIVKLSVFCG